VRLIDPIKGIFTRGGTLELAGLPRFPVTSDGDDSTDELIELLKRWWRRASMPSTAPSRKRSGVVRADACCIRTWFERLRRAAGRTGASGLLAPPRRERLPLGTRRSRPL